MVKGNDTRWIKEFIERNESTENVNKYINEYDMFFSSYKTVYVRNTQKVLEEFESNS